MLFPSIPFLYYFLPAALLLYAAAPKRWKNTVLLAASLIFYGWGEPKYLLLMVVTIAQGYVFGLLTGRFRGTVWATLSMAASVGISLLTLGVFKYSGFLIRTVNTLTKSSFPVLSLALPVGISFYTFQIISYEADVWRGQVQAQKHPVRLALYISMFPQLIAGPIVRYSDLEGQLKTRRVTGKDTAEGIRRFSVGLAKKVLIADQLAQFNASFAAADQKSVLFYWLYAAACTLQIYFDFSGYSDMAIGLGRLFGFRFCENFQYPYCSGSITEFWRRWHISLGTWFRDYLYIPLGGNRNGKLRWLRNILIVWLATGLWHGAAWNFVLWGLFFAVLLVVEKLWLLPLLKHQKFLNHIYVLFFVGISFVLFDASDVRSAFETIRSMAGLCGLPAVTVESLYYLKSYSRIFLAAAIGATPLPCRFLVWMKTRKAGVWFADAAEMIGPVILLAVSTAFLIDGSFHPFLYFRF